MQSAVLKATTMFEDEGYKPNRHHGIARRIATYLHWCSEKQPRAFIPYSEIAQAVLGMKITVAPNSSFTQGVRGELHRARDLTMGLYGQDIMTNGSSARATVDAEELFRFRLGNEMSRLAEQVARYGRIARLIQHHPGGAPAAMTEHAQNIDRLVLGLADPLKELFVAWNTIADGKQPVDDAPSDRALDG